MRTLVRFGVVFGIAALLANAAPVQAQQGGGGGRGGRGGPGGGGAGNLLQNEVVQKELKLDKDQIDKVKQIATDIREKHQDDFAGLRDLSQEERGEKMRELMKKVGEETTKALADVFKPEQLARYKQLQLQVRGVQAFTEADVQKDLKLTDEQKDKIKTINADYDKDMADLRAAGDFQAMRTKVPAMRKEAMEKAVAVLTDEQKESWKSMTGKIIDIPMGGGGRGGRKGKGGGGV